MANPSAPETRCTTLFSALAAFERVNGMTATPPVKIGMKAIPRPIPRTSISHMTCWRGVSMVTVCSR